MKSSFKAFYLDPTIYSHIKSLNILKGKRRGKRGGKRRNKGFHLRDCNIRGVNRQNLINIKPYVNILDTLNLGVINSQSLRNKSLAFSEYIVENSFDICVVVETWFRDSDAVIMTEATPNTYTLCQVPRPKRQGGGTALVCKSIFKPIKQNSGVKTSFEYSEWLISCKTSKLHIAIIYRPPYSPKHPVTQAKFMSEFDLYLSSLTLSSNNILITGDFNIPMNNLQDCYRNQFINLLDSHSLINHVNFPTNNKNNILDLLITRPTDSLKIKNINPGTLFSDHLFIHAKLSLPRPILSKKAVQFRNIKSINTNNFKYDLQTIDLTPPSHLNSAVSLDVEHFDKSLTQILDKHAPLLNKIITEKPNSPWFTHQLKFLISKSKT